MARRSRVKRSKSKKLFSRTATKTSNKNLRNKPMRGGWRL